MNGALGLLEERCRARVPDGWLLGERLTQADITVACIFSFLRDAMNLADAPPQYPALAALAEQCEALAEFRATRAPWFAAKVES
jgi:glutathione S-transferase